jgi:DNA-binding transcriptional ArsR family regulator
MSTGANLAEVAALVGDPGRATMLALMMDGRAHTSTELAVAADVTAATASEHLGKLLNRGLVKVAPRGRNRFYRLASNEVAHMLEGIMVVAGGSSAAISAGTKRSIPPELREARTCYDHLAGRLGVAITDALVNKGAVTLSSEGAEITSAGVALLSNMKIDADITRRPASRRPLCRPCLDWSERRPHLAGLLGAAILQRLLGLGWLERSPDSRAIVINTAGRRGLARMFDYNAS